jgi:predicted TIM-barrel fold metal-dependent hydrolase
VKALDCDVYQHQLQSFLPARLIDIHTHVWLNQFQAKEKDECRRAVTWPQRVALDNSMEDLLEAYRLMFPGKGVLPLVFGAALSLRDDLHTGNAYVRECAQKYRVPALLFTDPRWSEPEFEERIDSGHFLGAKVYLTRSDPRLAEKDIQIYDFLPHHQLKVLDKHGWIIMLHIPRPGRLRDPLNLAQMVEIEKNYPHVKVVIAHVGRAYCPEDVGNAFEILAGTRKMRFDISANTSAENFARLIRTVGPRRILFGSDLPITRMRMRRVCEGGRYINVVPKGLYGDVSADPHMREVEGDDAERLTLFMYEEVQAFQQAALAGDAPAGGRHHEGLLESGHALPGGVRKWPWRHPDRCGRQHLPGFLLRHLCNHAGALSPPGDRGRTEDGRPVNELPRLHHAHQATAAREAEGDSAGRPFRRAAL